MKYMYIVAFCLLFSFPSIAQVQIGKDIDGERQADESGRSISLSLDGSVVAIGAWWNDGNGSNSGHIRIYQNKSGTWTQVGEDINGEKSGDYSGNSVSLSSDGSIVAIGAVNNDGNGSNSGHVRIYHNQSGTWTQIGKDINGEAASNISGSSVSLSSDGSIVAIGARLNNGNGAKSGHVRIYQNKSGTWTQLGKDIDGEAAGDESGYSVSLSSDGSIVAIGAFYNDDNGMVAGHVRIYQIKSGTWTQLGQDIDGEAAGDFSGNSVSLSSDGSVVAIGAYKNDGNGDGSGHVRIYQYKSGTWTQLGKDIDGEAAGDFSGSSVSLSSDGKVVAIGAPSNYGNGVGSGHVRIYHNQSGTWTQLGKNIQGEAIGDASGSSVSLSSDGKVVAVGAPYNYGNGLRSGHVRLYSLEKCDLLSITTNPMDVTMQIGNTAVIGMESNYKSYQWQTDTGIGYENITNMGQFNGSDTDTLSIMLLTLSNNNQYFRCILSTDECADTSEVATLTVCGSQSITANPMDVTMQIGKTAVMALESNYKFFQWQTDTGSGYENITNTGQFDGAKKDTLSIMSLTLSNNNQYFRCIVSTGLCSDTSKVAVLTVECEFQSITSNPRNVTMPIGKSAIMELESNYKSYQWQTDTGSEYKNVTNIGQFEGADTDTLSIMQLTMSNNNQKFRCIVSKNGCADTSEVAVLKVDGNVGLKEIEGSFRVYPNPTSKELKIKIDVNLMGSVYTISDPLGREVKQGTLTSTMSSIDVSELSKGYYLLQIGEGTYSYKFLVQ
jgi:hypothetical protein